jgi:hypothetical protein
MEYLLAKTLISLSLVIILAMIILKIMQRFYKNSNFKIGNQTELSIIDSIYLDPANRLVTVARGQKKYILLLGKNSEKLIDICNDEIND